MQNRREEKKFCVEYYGIMAHASARSSFAWRNSNDSYGKMLRYQNDNRKKNSEWKAQRQSEEESERAHLMAPQFTITMAMQ